MVPTISWMSQSLLAGSIGAALLTLTCGSKANGRPITDEKPAAARASEFTAGELDTFLETVRKKYDLPALAVGVIENGEVTRTAAVGFRKYGDPTRVTVDDTFHIGSCTKSMTATLTAKFVDEGKIRWDTTLAEAFPELANTMRPEFKAVTVLQLLSHRAGLPTETWPPNGSNWAFLKTPITEQRQDFVRLALQEPPQAPPGTKFIYSNRGYIIVGAMLERIAGVSWETLIQRMLFQPLHMTTAGFGVMASPDKIDQPWPHYVKDGKHIALAAGIGADNPPAIGPAGTVHCSIGDLAKYAAFHLHGSRGSGNFLKPDTFAQLYKARFEGDYALGWIVADREWGGGNVLNHNGSNTLNYAVIWMAPKRNFGVVIATNQGNQGAAEACDDVAGMVVSRLGKTYANVAAPAK